MGGDSRLSFAALRTVRISVAKEGQRRQYVKRRVFINHRSSEDAAPPLSSFQRLFSHEKAMLTHLNISQFQILAAILPRP